MSSSELCFASLSSSLWLVEIPAPAGMQPRRCAFDPSQNPGDVYYVHASDGPSSIAVKLVLNHSNYQAWARSMRQALG
ncbi:hypothetical protein A2U01_0052708, partial [Trifolium medium]|nr:hypothetical protein [Trifolium medium]